MRELFGFIFDLGGQIRKQIESSNTSVHADIIELSEGFIENVIGCFPLPLGVATNFYINGRDLTLSQWQ